MKKFSITLLLSCLLINSIVTAGDANQDLTFKSDAQPLVQDPLSDATTPAVQDNSNASKAAELLVQASKNRNAADQDKAENAVLARVVAAARASKPYILPVVSGTVAGLKHTDVNRALFSAVSPRGVQLVASVAAAYAAYDLVKQLPWTRRFTKQQAALTALAAAGVTAAATTRSPLVAPVVVGTAAAYATKDLFELGRSVVSKRTAK